MYMYADQDTCEKECFACEESGRTIEDVKYWLEAVVEHIYSKEIPTLEDFERCLQELCATVGMKLPTSEMMMQRNGSKLPHKMTLDRINASRDLNWWKVMNNNHLKLLA